MRLKFIIILFLIYPLMSCGKSLKANLIMDSEDYKYSVPFEQGFVLIEDGKVRILLKFYKPNELFRLDTDERIIIFIATDDQYLNKNISNTQAKIFIIRVQMHGCTGNMKIINLETRIDSTSNINISGDLLNDSFCPKWNIPAKLHLMFKELPLKSVSSLNELKEQCIEYDVEELNKEFGQNWF